MTGAQRPPVAADSRASSGNSGGCLCDLSEELGVGAGAAELVDQQLEPGAALERVEHAAQLPGLLQVVAVEQQLFVPRARLLDVDRRVDAPVGNAAVEPEL